MVLIMMEHLFIKILNMSLTAGIVIAVVMVVRLFFGRAPKIFSYLLWAVVLFRLLCPISFSSALSLFKVLSAPSADTGRMVYIPDNIGIMAQPETDMPLPLLEEAVNASLPQATVEQSVNPMQIILSVGCIIWLLGVFLMVLYNMAAYVRLRGVLKDAVWEEGNVYRIRDMGTPFVCGIFSPRIYLPSALDGNEKQYILLHERIHIRRGDHIWRIAGCLALCLHWFNPLVWFAFFLSGKDMEMSCDEAVIRELGSGVKKEYSASLLSLASGRRIVPGMPLAFGEGETGSRIKNILRYKKPAQIAVCAVFALCMLLLFVLASNPDSENSGSLENAGNAVENFEDFGNPAGGAEVFYGVVSDIDFEGSIRRVVTIPGIGDVEIPEAEEVYPRIEIEYFNGPEPGDLLEITFPVGEMAQIQETYPASFSGKAQSIVINGQGFMLRPSGDGAYEFTVPWGLAQDAEVGNVLAIYYHGGETGGDAWALLAEVTVFSVDIENYDVWVELSAEEVTTFMKMFGLGIRCEVMEKTEPAREEDEQAEGDYIRTDSEIPNFSAWQFENEELADGTYRIYAVSLSYSAKGIDKYFALDMEDSTQAPVLAFSKECKFYVNQEMNRLSYGEVSFETFADLAEEMFSYLNPPVLLTFEDGLITSAILEEYYGGGISYASMAPDTWYTDIQRITQSGGEEVLAKYYELENTYRLDVGYAEGVEQAMVYTGNIGDGESGIVLFTDADDEVLYTLSAHIARAGWNNIYLGERDGEGFIMTVQIEDRDTYGEYGYHVFRLSPGGEVIQTAGSSFYFNEGVVPYDDAAFSEWAKTLQGYLADSYLILSTQDGALRTEAVSEADKYNYETLRRGKER